MTTVDFEPLSVTVPLREHPPGVFRVGNTRGTPRIGARCLQGRGESPEAIVRSYRALRLADVYAVISRIWRTLSLRPVSSPLRAGGRSGPPEVGSSGMTSRVSREELLARARAKGLVP